MGTASAPASRRRILSGVLLGACLGGIGAALFWQFYPGFWKEPAVAASEIALQQQRALREQAQRQAARAAALAAAAQPAPAPGPCDGQALIPAAGPHDGRASVEHPFPGGPRARAKAFLRAAQAAAAQGRQRDAEVALLAACRENDQASRKPTVPLARVLGMLGERYAAAAGSGQSEELRARLLERARRVLALSAAAYDAALGPNASRSRQARLRLAALERDFAAVAHGPPQRQARARDELARKAPRPPREGAEPPQPPPQPQQPQQPPAPVRAGIASTPELRQLESDLARLRAQAEAVSDDPAGFSGRAAQARARRDQCRDAACLRAWYTQRRQELLAEF